MTRRFASAILFGISVILLPGLSFSLSIPADKIVEKGNLQRFPDPVTIQAERLPAALSGGVLENYRVYACHKGRFEPIRFQIDEMTEGGDFIFPYGKKSNKKLSNGIMDSRDLLLFMAHDAGDRVPETFWPKNATHATEIEVVDPIDKSRAWTYLFFFEKDPPPLCPLPDYTKYDYETETLGGEYWRTSYIINKKKKHTNVYKEFAVLPKGGGTGENFIDRLKIRSTIKLFFGKITLTTDEERLESYVVNTWIQGPIRVVRRLEHIVRGPFKMVLVRILSDVYYYETMFTCPIHFDFPFKIERVVTSLSMRIGTDFSPVVKDSMFYNNNNLEGDTINGRMDETEANFNPKADSWRVMVGDWGAMMTRSVLTTEAENYLQIVQGITDDETYENPPETFPGNIGWTWQDWRIGQLPGVTIPFTWNSTPPPHYKPGGEVPYLNYMDHPITVKINGTLYENQARIFGKPGKGF